MATLTFTLSAEASAELVEALCWQHGYTTVIADVPVQNPETKAAFARRQIVLHLAHTVKRYREYQAKQQAAATTNPDIS